MRQRVWVRLREAAGDVLGEWLEGCWGACGSCGQGLEVCVEGEGSSQVSARLARLRGESG